MSFLKSLHNSWVEMTAVSAALNVTSSEY